MPRLTTSRTIMHLAMVSAFTVLSCHAQGQEATNNQNTLKKVAEKKDEIPEVIVTATRQSTTLLKTPVAVTAINAEDLLRANVKELLNLSGVIPNVQFGLSSSDSGVLVSIRGVTSTNFTEIGDPAVGIHIDGIYSPRPQGSLALMFDLDQVEVLRGAQGTLFGRNSTAGVINILPAKPEFKNDYGWTSLNLANYNGKEVRAVYNFGISDTFALRAAVMVDKRDGYLKQDRDLSDRGVKLPNASGGTSFSPDGKPDVDQRLNRVLSPKDYYTNSNQWATRLTARWAIDKDWEWTGGFEHYQNSGAGEVGLKDCAMAAGTKFACGPNGQWYTKINVPGKIDMSIDTFRSNLVWKFSPQTELGYKVAYAIQKRAQHHHDDGGQTFLDADVGVTQAWGNWGNPHALDWATYTLDSKYRSLVNEIQIKQNFDRWRYVAGVFNMSEKNAITFAQDNLVAAPWGMPQGQFYDQPDRKVNSDAIFAQADIKLTNQLSATTGIRYSKDSREDIGGISAGLWGADTPWYYNGKYVPKPIGTSTPHNGTDLTFGMGPFAGLSAYPSPTVNTHKKSWNKPTYRLGLQYDMDKSTMVFASIATGYRPGGFGDKFDTCGGGTCTDGSTKKYNYLEYNPELTTNFEMGYKGRHFNNKLDLSAVYFRTNYNDMHVTGMNAVGQRKLRENEVCPEWNPACEVVTSWKTENIGNARIQGLEIEYKARPWTGGSISGYVSVMDAKVLKYPTYDDNWICGYRVQFGAEPCAPIYLGSDPSKRGRAILDVVGNQLPRAPKFSYAINLSHDITLENGWSLTPSIGMRYQDRMYFTVRNLDNPVIGDYQDAYTNWNAGLRLAGGNGKWQVELWGTNLSNNIVKNWMGQGNAGGYTFNSYNPPRMFGVRTTINY
jgi:iron complex outermembrane receptor protein